MKRSGVLVVSVLALAWAGPAEAAGRSGADVCVNAGFRMGTLSFDLCVARVEGDDPLASLEHAIDGERVPVGGRAKVATPVEDALSALEPERIKPPVAVVKPPVREGEFPTVMGANFPGGNLPGAVEPPPSNNLPGTPPPSPPPPGAGGSFVTPATPTAPTPPTAPQINTFTVTVPAWNWGW